MVEWEKIESKGDWWQPEKVGDELIGKLIARIEGQYGAQFTIKRADGYEIKTPSHKVLQGLLEMIQLNTDVRIKFTGTELPKIKGRNPTQLYEVYKGK